MQSYQQIFDRAAERKGGASALEAMIAEWPSKSKAELAAMPDDRWLAEITRSVFQAGFNWSVIDNKWPGFETAFHGFDTRLNAAMSEEEFDAHLKDASIVRNGQKIASVRHNAQFLVDLATEHGSASKFFADWPDRDLVGLLEVMKKRAARCHGETAMRLLRRMGKPAFITTGDVSAALVEAGVLSQPPKNRKDYQAVQDAFNAWSSATGRDFNAISRTLALSIGPSYEPGAPPWPR
jgi:3-methyladenine DNA glycosylase Tag